MREIDTIPGLTEEMKDALRAVYDRHMLRADEPGLTALTQARRQGSTVGIERAAEALGFDIYADWQQRQELGQKG